jgi:type IV pilus assembly protein PilY1
MKLLYRTVSRKVLSAVIALSIALQPVAGSAALLNLAKSPLFVTPPIPPMVMLDISKDQQLFKKAYNDYSDLDSDGSLETTYKHSIDYYGYFDSYKCYQYVVGNSLSAASHYAPTSYTSNKYCDGTKWSGNFLNWATMTRMDTVRKLLFGGMRRDDTAESPSGASANTTLERANLPADAHAFAKWYGGSDVNQLTPFTVQTTPTITSTVTTNTAVNVLVDTSRQIEFDNMPTTFTDKLNPGDQIRATSDKLDGSGKPCVISGRVIDKNSNGTGMKLWVDVGGSLFQLDYNNIVNGQPSVVTSTAGTASSNCSGGGVTNTTSTTKWVFENLTSVGISICNVTISGATGTDAYSHTTTRLPLMRVAKGNYELWAGSEKFQCYWAEEKFNTQRGFLPDDQEPSSNGNQYTLSGLSGSAENPAQGTARKFAGNGDVEQRALGTGAGTGDYNVIVQVCHKSFTPAPANQKTTEKCKQYDKNGEYKPIGLLQQYGDDGRIRFGLFTGSYAKNTSGGVLRKNIGGLDDEINSSGVFITSPANGSIIGTLSRLRIFGYYYGTTPSSAEGTYRNDGAAPGCTYQLVSSELVDDMCRSWGNPMSEIYAESLRYFAGASAPTAAFNTDDSSLISGLTTATWPNPNQVVTAANYCAPLNVLVFNASVSSKDYDTLGAATPLDPFAAAISGFTPKSFTDLVGQYEGLNGKSFFVGSNGVTSDDLCSAKPFDGASRTLGSAQGICPEAPSLNGSYLMSGLAFAARTNRIRTDLNTTVPATDKRSLKVATYGISLATNVPRVVVPVPGSTTGQTVVIQPTYRLTNARGNVGSIGSGAIVDVKIVRQAVSGDGSTRSGRIYVNWEDSEQGGDYDQDLWGVIDYVVTATTASITTNVVSASSANPQGFGYTISGTDKDGPHFHSGIYNFNFTDPLGIDIYNPAGTKINGTGPINTSGGCNNCDASDVATTARYSISSSGAAQSLNDPLWYAAKYGGFVDSNGNARPDLSAEFDTFNNATGALGSDGIPDNYFLVSNPLGLEAALDKLFISILQASAASAVAANSSKLQLGTQVYQAVFNPTDWSGKLLAFSLDSATGVPAATPDWDGGQVSLNASSISPSSRVILTYNKGVAATAPTGIPFRWPGDPANPTTSELTAQQVAALRTNPLTATGEPVPSPYSATTDPGNKRLLYLRGDGSNEGTDTTNYRRRPTSKLGDIINSNPNFVAAPSAGRPEATYATFAETYKNRKPVIYVGANDGMLHAFNACPPATITTRPTGCNTGVTTPGAELLAYIPSKVFPNLSKLTARSYSHEYFVDGSPASGDVQIGTAWKTVLVGGLNRGGQGIYALDITNPENFTEANASSLVLWEFTDKDDPDLGFTFGTPVIAKMANGKWAAIIGGGYNNSQTSTDDPSETNCTSGTGTTLDPYPAGCSTSRTGYAYVFVIFMSGPSGTNGTWVQGTDYIKLSTAEGSVATPNGIASPFAADTNGDGLTDVIYAGDLNGNVWRFAVSNATATDWTASGARLKLFTARDASNNPQPITAGMEGALHPSGTGVIISFGTGKYLEASDISSADPPSYQTQTLYGIWDKGDGSAVSGRSALMQQLLQPGVTTNPVTNDDGSISRITTAHEPNYSTTDRTTPDNTKWDGATGADQINAVSTAQSTPAQRGWYLDLFNGQSTGLPKGERMIYAPILKSGILIFSSLWPINNSCLGSTAGENITLQISTGGRPGASVFDLNANGLVNAGDMVNVGTTSNPIMVAVSSRRIAGGSAQPPTLIAKGSQFVTFQNPTGGTLESPVIRLPGLPGRVSWREILF